MLPCAYSSFQFDYAQQVSWAKVPWYSMTHLVFSTGKVQCQTLGEWVNFHGLEDPNAKQRRDMNDFLFGKEMDVTAAHPPLLLPRAFLGDLICVQGRNQRPVPGRKHH